MEPRVDFITLGVPDLDAARRFYVDGLGWQPALEVEGEVIFIQVGHGRLLSLWRAEALAEDIGTGAAGPPGAGVALAHNVADADAVGRVLDEVAAAGGTVLRPPRRADWGGTTGYFADPAGFVWEVAHNASWSVDADGRVRIGPSSNTID